jgi:hypothetical protein
VTRSCYAPGASFNRWLYWYNAANPAFAATDPNIFFPRENLDPAIGNWLFWKASLDFPKPSLRTLDSGRDLQNFSLDFQNPSLDFP